MLKVLAITALVPLVAAVSAQRRTVWDGVYTEGQAMRGLAEYSSNCQRCHGQALDGAILGDSSASALRGDRFIDGWREGNVESLFTFIKSTMPPDARDVLSDDATLAILAFIMQANDFPAGEADLSVDALRAIRIEGKEGPRPLPNYASVQMVGCLTRSDGDNWTLSDASEPTRTRKSGQTAPDEVQAAELQDLGNGTFPLQNFAMLGTFDPELYEGHKMLAKGVLLRQATMTRLSLTALESVSPTCQAPR